MGPLILIHSFLDLLVRSTEGSRHPADWLRASRRVVLAAVVGVVLVVGMSWLVTEAPPSAYEVVACAGQPALGSKCIVSAVQ